MFSGDRRGKALTLGALCIALFMAMLDNTVVTVALPSIQRHFGSDVAGLQWILTGYILFFAAFMLTGGTLGDMYGRRRAFLAGLGIFTVGSLLCGLAPTLETLIGGRVIQGLGAALLMPGTLSLLTNTFVDPRERAQAIGIWAGVSGIALVLGPVIGGVFTDTFGWQSVFFLNVPIGIVAAVITWRAIPESKDPDGRRIDLPGQVLAVLALGSVTFAFIQAQALGWWSATTLSLLAFAAVAQMAFLWVESRSASPMVELRFFRDRTFATGVTVAAMVSFGMFGTLFFLTLYIQNVQGYSAFGMGIRALPLTLAMIVTAPLAGRLAGRFGSRIPMTVGVALNGVGLLLLLRLTPSMTYWQLWWNLLLLGVGMGLVITPMTAAVMSAVPRSRAGMASATTNSSREIGGVFGVALLGAVVARLFADDLRDGLRGFAIPAAAKSRIIELASHGRQVEAQRVLGELGGSAAAGHAGNGTPLDPATLHAAIGSAYVAGMLPAIFVAAVVLLIGAVLTYVFVRPGVPEAEPAAADAAARATASLPSSVAGPPVDAVLTRSSVLACDGDED
jgi:EmrB/QacA subfamily drug resistance transporter